MRVLIVGSGGREHALLHGLRRSEPVEIFVAPGNAGTSGPGVNVDIPATDVTSLCRFARDSQIDLTVVGPEQPLVKGIVDEFRANRLPIVGPSASAARLEGSKAFAKDFMARHSIPTARYRTFSTSEYSDARDWIRSLGAPVVVKASGLAAGKGAVVCTTIDEAENAAGAMLLEKTFGDAGLEIVVEEFMKGEEASVFAVCAGCSYVLLPSAQDHKRVGEGDTGPNTGGMGAYAPAPIVDGAMLRLVEDRIIRPTLEGLSDEGMPYNGFLYVGLMIREGVPRVVEFNCRLGDPEAQVVLPMLDDGFLELMRATAADDLTGYGTLKTRSGAAACVVLCSGGYPGPYTTGHPIEGLEEAESTDDVVIFHAGTTSRDGRLVTSGGRVLGITGLGASLEEALRVAYDACGRIRFQDVYFRSDIGVKGLKRPQLA